MQINKNNISKVINELEKNPRKYAMSVQIPELVSLLIFLSKAYYTSEKNLVSDEIFDVLKDTLEERDPTNPYLEKTGVVPSKEKVKLPFPMPSLDKIKPESGALNKWKQTYKGPYTLSDKLDGISAMLYKNDSKYYLYTRGDATSGRDISHMIPYVFGTKLNNLNIPDGVAIRGELIFSKVNFIKIKDKYENARNAVIGVVGSKKTPPTAKLVDFVAYSLLYPEYTHQNQIKVLKKMGLQLVHIIVKKVITNEILSTMLQERRSKSPYEVDGIVVVDANEIYENLSSKPKYAFAFKMVLGDQVAETTVTNVKWTASRYGYLKPIVQVMPVRIGGSTIKNVTGINAKYIMDNNLGPGAVIELVKSGDVIPKIEKIIKPAAEPSMPNVPYKWTDTKVDIFIGDTPNKKDNDDTGIAHKDVIIQQITYFFSAIGAKYISEGIVTKLVDYGLTDIFKILKADQHKLENIEGMGQVIVNKIFTSIKGTFEKVSMEQLMAASNTFGRGLGIKKLKTITKLYPNVLAIDPKTFKPLLLKIDGWDDKTATQFVTHLNTFKQFFKQLETVPFIKLDRLKNPSIPKRTGTLFTGQRIVFTGFRSTELEDYITANGGTVSSTVSKNTTLLVYKEDSTSSSKYLKAKDLGVGLIELTEFVKKFNA